MSPTVKRLLGIGLFIFSAAMTYYVWHNAMQTGTFRSYFALAFPIFAIIGLALAVFGEALTAGMPDFSQGTVRFRDYPMKWKILGVVALIAGFVNILLLDGTLPMPF